MLVLMLINQSVGCSVTSVLKPILTPDVEVLIELID